MGTHEVHVTFDVLDHSYCILRDECPFGSSHFHNLMILSSGVAIANGTHGLHLKPDLGFFLTKSCNL